MTHEELVDRLASLRALAGVPREELEWLASHGSVRQLHVDELLSHKAEPVEGLFFMLEGRVAIFVDRGAGRHKMMEWREGDASGVLPYSRLVNPPGDTVALEPGSILMIPRALLPEMIRACHQVTTALVHLMLDRARVFNASDLHDEKMVSLGKLSAGLAHELNNPASAIERSAALLPKRLDAAERATRALGAARLTDEELAAVDAVRAACLATAEHGVRSPIEHAEREEEIADWLEAHGLDAGIADVLADTSVTLGALDQIAGAVQGPALNAALRWTAAGCSVRRIANEILEASARISGLILAVKGFTQMDRATVAEPVDVVHGLDNTIAVLRAKARHKSAAVKVQVAPDVPRVRGFSGELNQIWANLIDNALDAIPEAGRVEVFAEREGGRVLVRVVDDGPGIPDDILARIFDPFFTTKPQGHGTGLGLDIVRRLVLHNDGEIAVESRPGRTEFRVALPVADGNGAAR